MLLLVLFPRSRSPVVGVPGLCWMWQDVPFARQRRPVAGILGLCWLLWGSFDCFCRPHTSVPTHPHQKTFPQAKNEIYQRGRKFQADFRYTKFLWSLTPPPGVRVFSPQAIPWPHAPYLGSFSNNKVNSARSMDPLLSKNLLFLNSQINVSFWY